MVRQWLESHELPAIIAGVLGVIITLAALLVVGRYLLVTPDAARFQAQICCAMT